MYQQVFSLILLMLIINFSTELSEGLWPLTFSFAMGLATLGYALCLGVIYLQNRALRLKRPQMSLLVQLELLAYFTTYLLVIGVQTNFNPFFRSLTILSFICLIFYFFALAFFRYTFERITENRWDKVKGQTLFLLPFLIPYFALTAFFDLFGDLDEVVMTMIMGVILALSLLFLPFFLQKFWQCTPLPDNDLHRKLECICQQAQFKHGGIKIWTVMGSALTAAIVGLLPRFRYIMFTPNLIKVLASEHIEAILAHEIGHSKHHHLIFYPFIAFGMMITVGLFFLMLGGNMDQALEPIFAFIPYALIIWLYFRYIFGYFSRLFERQADLYGFRLQMSPEQMIGALDHVAIAAGNIHRQPSWHHFSIQQRIDFLKKVTEDHSLIAKHDRKVIMSLILYFLLLILGTITLFWY